MKPLTPAERRELRAKAHHLDPVVTVGQHGLTPPVLHEIDVALLAHELVKVRVFNDEREAREAMLGEICTGLDCAPVQHLGKILVLWRPNPDRKPASAAAPARAAKTAGRKPAGPRAPVDPVRERRRSATGTTASGKGRRGAARNAPPEEAAPAAKKKSTYTPRTKPKSHSAKPNPRSAWQKKEPAAPAAGTRRRRTRV
ncbi:MAG: YhbY family RNA-binding protein [Burkholderiales bacterium]